MNVLNNTCTCICFVIVTITVWLLLLIGVFLECAGNIVLMCDPKDECFVVVAKDWAKNCGQNNNEVDEAKLSSPSSQSINI